MTEKPLDCVGTDGSLEKHDFMPSVSEPIIHGPGEPQGTGFRLTRRTPESQERYYSDKIAELVLTQGQLARAIAERDALKAALADILNRTKNFGQSGFPSMAHFKAFADAHIEATETLARLESGEMKRPTA